MLLWITDDLETRLPLGTLCGHCGESIKYLPRIPGAPYDTFEYTQVKLYLVRMLKWELNNTPWQRKGEEYCAAVFPVYESLVDNFVSHR